MKLNTDILSPYKAQFSNNLEPLHIYPAFNMSEKRHGYLSPHRQRLIRMAARTWRDIADTPMLTPHDNFLDNPSLLSSSVLLCSFRTFILYTPKR